MFQVIIIIIIMSTGSGILYRVHGKVGIEQCDCIQPSLASGNLSEQYIPETLIYNSKISATLQSNVDLCQACMTKSVQQSGSTDTTLANCS